MRVKLKLCYGCDLEKVIWRNFEGHKYCMQCWFIKFPIKPIQTPSKSINKVSKNRQAALKVYRRVRDKFLLEHPKCMFPGCNSLEVTLHHGHGRLGSFLTNKKYFKSLCWPHHQYIEEHPEEAKKLGLSYSRLEK